MSFYKKLRNDNSIISLSIKNPKRHAIWDEKLNKYAISFQSYVNTPILKKKLGFKDSAFFSIIVDVEEEVYLNVFRKKISKVWVCCDSCDLVTFGGSFSVFWRNQREPDREFRIYFESGDMLRFTRKGCFLKAAANKNKKEGV